MQGSGLDPAQLVLERTDYDDPKAGPSVRVELTYPLDGFSMFPVDEFIPQGLTASATTKME
ncbi:hypothetical protein [Desulfohalovibrio reitneri]|uniref:hypothetical protein n=1 Tax=Desulfohalovibrio reitneri TaxID=1307759 RepID=UPI000A532797|nr:hypothetical protein [Desulfohalovibrio reitneri]